MPSLIACAFGSNADAAHGGHAAPRVAHLSVHRLRAVPALERGRAAGVVEGVLDALAEHGLIERIRERAEWRRPPPNSAQAVQLSLLAQATIQTIERYYLAVALLLQGRQRRRSRQSALEERCQLMAPAHDHAVRLQLAGVLRPQRCSSTSSTCCATRGVVRVSRRRQARIRRGAGAGRRRMRSSCSTSRSATASCRSRTLASGAAISRDGRWRTTRASRHIGSAAAHASSQCLTPHWKRGAA